MSEYTKEINIFRVHKIHSKDDTKDVTQNHMRHTNTQTHDTYNADTRHIQRHRHTNTVQTDTRSGTTQNMNADTNVIIDDAECIWSYASTSQRSQCGRHCLRKGMSDIVPSTSVYCMIRIGCAVIGVEESRVEDANVRRYGASRECDWTDGSCTLDEE